MAQALVDTKENLSGGGGNFFKLNGGQSAQIRFLYNTIDDVKLDGRVAHSFKPEETGQKYTVDVLCAAKSDETKANDCRYCAENRGRVGRYPLALYNETNGQIEYWGRTKKWVDGTLFTVLENVVKAGFPISGQVFTIIRANDGSDTQYTLLPKGDNDGKMPSDFGKVLTPEERNCYRPENYVIPTSSNGGANYINPNNQAPQQNFGSEFGGFGSTRRTTDVF